MEVGDQGVDRMIESEGLRLGQLVYATRGHDKGQAYLIYKFINSTNYVLLVDGKKRTVKNPKKKNLKHINPVDWISEEIERALQSGAAIRNEAIQSALSNGIKAMKEGSLLG